MGILSFIGSVIKPATELIDELHTSDEEKGRLKNQLTKIENMFAGKVLEYEGKIAQMKADVIMAEAKGESWLQRTWRPITMLTFLALIVAHYLGLLVFELSPEMWVLTKIGVGGYIGSRGAEKIVPAVVKAIKGGNNG
jgi:hypothetical protein